MAKADRDDWRMRALAEARDKDVLRRRADVDERQLLRLKVADRRRVAAVIQDLAAAARAKPFRVAVFGAGAHTEWLLRETSLATIADLLFFDSDSARVGGTIAGYPIRAAAEIPAAQLGAVIVSSLAFQDEMLRFVESLAMPGVQLITCYP